MASTLKELISELQPRPAMYLGNDLTLCRLSAFIEGWIMGIGTSATNKESLAVSQFTEFVAKKYEISAGYGWERIVALVAEKGSTDLDAAFKLFDEFFEQNS